MDIALYRAEKSMHHITGTNELPDGTVWAIRSWHGQNSKPYARVRQLPGGWIVVDVHNHEVMSFVDFACEYYGFEVVTVAEVLNKSKQRFGDGDNGDFDGYVLVDGDKVTVFEMRNAQAKWDSYDECGGRYARFLKLRGSDTRVNWAYKYQIDVEGMQDEAGDKAAREYDLVAQALLTHGPYTSWDAMMSKHGDIDEARREYHNQPIFSLGLSMRNFDDFLVSREEYIRVARYKAIMTYAVICDGKWMERGEMGWFGVANNEMSYEEWVDHYQTLFESLPKNALLTVVDCHI